MPIIRVKKADWKRQPQQSTRIGRGNKFFAGLQGLFTQNGSGTLFDVVGRRHAIGDTSTLRGFVDGVGRDYSGGQNTQFQNLSNYGLASALTIVAVIDVDALTNYGAIVSMQDTAATNGWELRLGNGATDSRIIFHRANAGYRQHAASAANMVSAGQTNVFIAVTCANNLLETIPKFKVDGINTLGSLANGDGTGAQIASTAALWLGARAAGATQLDGGIKYIGLWDRELPSGDLEELRQNLWQVFESESFDLSFASSPGTTPVTSDIGLQWDTLSGVTSDSNLQWNMLNNITSDASLRWDVRNAITSNISLQWDVQSSLTAVTSDLGLQWDIRSAVVSDANLQWSILNQVTSDSNLRWNILNAISSDMGLQWNMLQAVQSDIQARWDVLSALTQVVSDLGISWNVLSAIQSSITLQWTIQSDGSTPTVGVTPITGFITINPITGYVGVTKIQ